MVIFLGADQPEAESSKNSARHITRFMGRFSAKDWTAPL
jgi:hypothetical protein